MTVVNHYIVVADNNNYLLTVSMLTNPYMVVVPIVTAKSKPLNLIFSYTSITERRQQGDTVLLSKSSNG